MSKGNCQLCGCEIPEDPSGWRDYCSTECVKASNIADRDINVHEIVRRAVEAHVSKKVNKLDDELLRVKKARNDALDHIKLLRGIVVIQAEDEGLWFKSQYITEDYLQKALRELHGAIEGENVGLIIGDKEIRGD